MTTVFVVIGVTVILCVAYRIYEYLFPPPDISSNGKYVLVTGCDSGFGHTLAVELDKTGFHVLAGVYNPDNEESLTHQLSSRATVFCLDITREEEIDAAYEMVLEKTTTLHALVNNAGIAKAGLIDWTSVEFIRETMDVNFFGHVTMTKKFLPLLISQRGSRVVNITSVLGFIALSGLSAYAASKFALEAFSDSLRREMHVWGLHVSIIEPGFMRTPLLEGIEQKFRKFWETVDPKIRQRWGEKFFDNFTKETINDPLIRNAENPRKVVAALRHAVINSVPKIRYRPGWQSSLFFFPLSMLPTWTTDYLLIKSKGSNVTPEDLFKQQT